MENEILVMYEGNRNWTKLNANPVSSKMAVNTLYAVAPFLLAKVNIGWLPTMYYTYDNGHVKRLNKW